MENEFKEYPAAAKEGLTALDLPEATRLLMEEYWPFMPVNIKVQLAYVSGSDANIVWQLVAPDGQPLGHKIPFTLQEGIYLSLQGLYIQIAPAGVKPCPFCGITPEIREAHSLAGPMIKQVYHQGGNKCLLGGHWFNINKWNTREP